MKYVLTGHRAGLGEALFLRLKYYQKHKINDVVGFDLTDGFDIGQLSNIAKIVWTSKDADVFINNAYDAVGQTKLLEYFLKSWQSDSTKLIVNIGSFLLDEPESYYKNFNPKELEYVVQKKKQREIINNHRQVDPLLKIIQINPGLLETNFVKSLGGTLPNIILHTTSDTADLIIKIIDMSQNGLYTKEVTLINLPTYESN